MATTEEVKRYHEALMAKLQAKREQEERAKQERVDREHRDKMTRYEARQAALLDPLRIPRQKYQSHKAGAKTRGVPFLLTFEEWWKLWQDSGHWEDRGNFSECYCMCRNADQGAYAVGNVRIDTVRNNCLEQITIAQAKHEAYCEEMNKWAAELAELQADADCDTLPQDETPE